MVCCCDLSCVQTVLIFPVFISPEMILSKEFTQDVIWADSFRERLRLFAVDGVHTVEDWKYFRPFFSKIGVLRSRLPAVPYLGVTGTLAPDSEQGIREAGGFGYYCKVQRTSIDRPEIAIVVLFAEGRLNTFDDLRRFFPLEGLNGGPVRSPKDIPKTVFYFNTIKLLLSFMNIVRKEWMPEFRYPGEARRWIQPYFALMSAFDKDYISSEFEKSDASADEGHYPIIRILAASEGYGLGADNPDIRQVVNFRVPTSLNSATQRMGRAMRNGQAGGRFFLVADPFVSTTRCPPKPPRRQRKLKASSSQASQLLSGSDSDISTPVEGVKKDQEDAARREKLPRDLVDFINAPLYNGPRCHRLALLGAYYDSTYKGERRSNRPQQCCSLCNPDLVPPFRPLPSKDSGSAYKDIVTTELLNWRNKVASELLPEDYPILPTAVLSDALLGKVARLDPFDIKNNPDSLLRKLRYWRYAEPYKEEVHQVFQKVASFDGPTMASALYAAEEGKRVKKLQKSKPDATPIDAAAKRLERKYNWLISQGRQDLVPAKAKQAAKQNIGTSPKARDKRVAQHDLRHGVVKPPQSQGTSQSPFPIQSQAESNGSQVDGGSAGSQEPEQDDIMQSLLFEASQEPSPAKQASEASPRGVSKRQPLQVLDPNRRMN